eukprot:m.99686 g.99686  ORF g.99686 m.99686 type:complete len:73 (-) comp13149_c0_seq3:512-730(-)
MQVSLNVFLFAWNTLDIISIDSVSTPNQALPARYISRLDFGTSISQSQTMVNVKLIEKGGEEGGEMTNGSKS